MADTECYLLEALVLAGRPGPALQLGRRLIRALDRLAPGQVVTVTARRLVAIAAYQNGTGNPSGDLDAALNLARAQGSDLEIARILHAQASVLEAHGQPVPRALLTQRRRILASHSIVFELANPLEARA